VVTVDSEEFGERSRRPAGSLGPAGREGEVRPRYAPTWLTVVSWIFALVFACTGLILYGLFCRGYRQHMRVLEAV